MFALETSLPNDPFWIAECLWSEPGAVLLWSGSGGGESFVSCWPSEERSGLDPEPELPWPPPEAGDTRRRAPRWIGLIPYEATRERMERPRYRVPERRSEPHHTEARWWRYPAFVCLGRRVSIVGEDAKSVFALRERLGALDASRRGQHASGGARLERRREQEPPELHAARIRSALQAIRAGELYQLNLARRLTIDVEGSTLALLAHLGRRAPAAYGFACELGGVASTSPELCLRTDAARRALTIPIKGTRPRGTDAAEDFALRLELDADPKERAELAMIVDVERNDLGRVACVGSVTVRAPEIAAHPTLFHRQASVSARISDAVSRERLLRSMLPSGSVTGAPKVRAMELIAELEAERRGLYTGAFGMLRHDGCLDLAMAIRTLTRRDGEGHYFVGGGIVLDSDAEREVRETEWKALQL